ncbi:pyridoxamine 5'-phosphate oxidase [Spirosoma sp. BT702]|uniref:Pyridoxine/pyridoxamine 5'-phosphate oxidase n=1 Tax=Spirosoma profusum TaxID=2771354 RepID=A0A926XWB4_9BACT|nr:pyridoxamine 5'-phosphate oxidase [Spirosoma profusum]MBD2701709.1 pyridoxamine 5'-phosphate oxidase [Spirosoma profusum]
MSSDISHLRNEYTLAGLDVADVLPDPIAQFQNWFDAAVQAKVPEPNAMHLNTVTPEGRPDGRIVLLKGVSEAGFVFFTNYESRKGQELIAHPFASLTFFYPDLERQIRVEGRGEKVSSEESDTYFNSRPRGSQIGAWASHQSSVIPNRDVLEIRQHELETQFANQTIPRPTYWGGFRIVPDVVEFWQGRPSRLHDRIRYRKEGESWVIERLSP